MNRLWGKFRQGLNTKFGFFMLITGLFWIKSYIAYQTKFTLGVQGGMQELILAISRWVLPYFCSGLDCISVVSGPTGT